MAKAPWTRGAAHCPGGHGAAGRAPVQRHRSPVRSWRPPAAAGRRTALLHQDRPDRPHSSHGHRHGHCSTPPFSDTRCRGGARARGDHRPRPPPTTRRRRAPGRVDKSAEGSHEVRGRALGVVGYGDIGGQLCRGRGEPCA
ncbi:hypothetical protein QJS66_11545 [Kocuria rhizophila]|nr:hypothetical protein QJS66_11545 [Kocuria rhizophila]